MSESKFANPVLECIMTRRSVRSFTDRRIDRAAIETITRAACSAPSAKNRQNWRFTVLQNSEKLAELADLVAAALSRGSEYSFYGCDAFIICSAPADYRFGPDDCACSLQNIFLASASLGIGSVWINQLRDCCDDSLVRAMLRDFGIPDDHAVYGCAALGYPEGKPFKEVEKNLSAIHWVE